jgi:HK97 family phage major capsid protein
MTTTESPAEVGKNTKMGDLRERLDDIDAELVSLNERGFGATDPEQDKWDDLVAERDALWPEYEKLEERAKRIDEIQSTTRRKIRGEAPRKKPLDDLLSRDVQSLSFRETRDAALGVLDDKEAAWLLTDNQLAVLDRGVRDARSDLAMRTLVTENEYYRSAFHKLMTDPNAAAMLTEDERQAVRLQQQYRSWAERAQSETTTAGGFAIPVFIDPSIILTDQESANPFLSIARTVDINTNAWKGVNAAGMSWSFDAENTEVSDDALTIAQPSVTVFQARGFIPYSIEIGEDWPGFQAEMARVLAIGYDELLIDKFSRGSGSGEPRGILTALAASSPTVIVTSLTDGAFGQEDIYAVWSALPQKYRRRASFMMNVDINDKIRQFGTSNVYHASTVTLPANAIEVLFGRPVYESPYFPVFSSTTGASNRLVVGNFDNYVIARRTGMTVEFVPQLFSTGNGRPTGSRGWFAHARIGGNSVNDAAFRMLSNT